MHLVFISTLYNPRWGGCEVLWSSAAMRALEQGHRVSLIVSEREKLDAPLECLKNAGARLYFWKAHHPAPHFFQRLFKKLSGRGLPEWEWWHQNLPRDADVICLNQGGALCGPMRHGLTEAIQATGKPYVVLARADTGFEFLTDRTRTHVRQFFEGAKAFVSASQSAIDLLRLYLPSKLPNAQVLHSPLADYGGVADSGYRISGGEVDLTTKDTNKHEILTTDVTDEHGYSAGQRPGSLAGSAFSNPYTSELARDSENTPLNRCAIGPAPSSPVTCYSLPATAPEAHVIEMACVGRLRVGDKGQHLLLACLAEEPWLSRSFRLSFYGEGPDRKYLEELVGFYGLGKKVRFAGYTSDVAEIWRKSHLAVQPSFVEGAPQSLLEAMLCRRPCVATAVSGIPEWVEGEETGFLAEAPTVHYLRLALERAWESRQRWAEMGEAARAACLSKRDPDPAGTLLALLHKAVERGGRNS